MPTAFPNSSRLSLTIDGRPSPDIAAALLRWELGERPKDTVNGELEVSSAGAAASAIGSLRLGASIGLTLASERVFDGQLLALEGRVSASDVPSVILQLKGTRPPEIRQAGSLPPALRIGIDILQAQVRQERSPVVFRLSAETTGDFATGSAAMRVGTVVGLVGMGPLFDGPFQLERVALRYDETRGLSVAVTGQR
ncbi:MAG TPA: hypothetical protein VN326_06345 [Casimicrobiaceae bacterium]|jgi:hypothetical protein|nr:hypothetical protein [Casimicrobiaceae bacterium]